MGAVQLIKKIGDFSRSHAYEMVGGACLITCIVLLALAIHQIHFGHVSLDWVRFNPRILLPCNLPVTMILFGCAGAMGGAALFFLKCSVMKRVEKKIEQKIKNKPFLVRRLQEMHYVYCLLILIAIGVGVLLVLYGSHYLATLHKVFNMGSMGKFYSLGYLAKGHAIEWAIIAITGGAALGTYGSIEAMKKGVDTYVQFRSEKK